MGGAAGVSLLLGMVKTKFAAVLIGPLGVGLIASYGAITGMVGTVAGLGIQSSAVRDVAAAYGRGDEAAMGKAVLVLRRVCWLTGVLGAAALILLAKPASNYTFGTADYAFDIRLLGLTIFFGNIQGGQMALIQGTRRIAELARLNVIGAVLGTLISVSFYLWLGIRGIIPALLLMSATSLIVSWHYARKIPVTPQHVGWRETLTAAGGMVRLGMVFMWNGLLLALVAYLTRAWINQQISLEAVGIFSAAFALSGMFINFVLSAMGADFYPRLTAVADDHAAMRRLVNEQTEIGLLLAIPGLLATLTLAPWVIRLFYTAEFLPAVELLQWFILGCLGRVISWPLGFIMLAKAKANWFFFTETSFNVLHLGMIYFGLMTMGLQGVAISFFLLYVVYILGTRAVAGHLIDFNWSASVQRLMLLLLPVVFIGFLIGRYLPLWPATATGLFLSLLAFVFCLRGLVQRVGKDHLVARMGLRLPGMRWIVG